MLSHKRSFLMQLTFCLQEQAPELMTGGNDMKVCSYVKLVTLSWAGLD